MTAAGTYQRLRRFLGEELWTRELHVEGLGSLPIRGLQFLVMVVEGFIRDRLMLRATALAYMTALSLIPVLAIGVSVIGSFGMREDVTAFVAEQIAAGSPAATEWILRILAGVNLGSLGGLGAAVLLVTTVLAIGNVERAFNDIWGVRRQRTWTRRFPDYLAVLLVAPLFVGLALSLGTLLQSQAIVQQLLEAPWIGSLTELGLARVPVLALYALGFGFLYWFLPNTEVRVSSALLGGVVAALVFHAAQAAYLGFNVGAARSSALFGTFAVLPLFLVWIYVSWTIVLLGAEMAFAHQNLAHYRREVRTREATAAEREGIGIAVALVVARRFGQGESCSAEELTVELDIPVRMVRDVLADLEAAGIVSPRGGADRAGDVQLARPIETVTVADLRAALRGPERAPAGGAAVAQLAAQVSREIENSVLQGVGAETLADLLQRLPAGLVSEGSVSEDPG